MRMPIIVNRALGPGITLDAMEPSLFWDQPNLSGAWNDPGFFIVNLGQHLRRAATRRVGDGYHVDIGRAAEDDRCLGNVAVVQDRGVRTSQARTVTDARKDIMASRSEARERKGPIAGRGSLIPGAEEAGRHTHAADRVPLRINDRPLDRPRSLAKVEIHGQDLTLRRERNLSRCAFAARRIRGR